MPKSKSKESEEPGEGLSGSGVIFLKDVPDGFFEHEQRDYFTQFGKVTNVRILRSRKTARSRGCAWVRFQDHVVAQIAADTMNNYLMQNHLLKCSTLILKTSALKEEPDSDINETGQSLTVTSDKYSLLLHSSDDEIAFQTPPLTTKKRKNSKSASRESFATLSMPQKKGRK